MKAALAIGVVLAGASAAAWSQTGMPDAAGQARAGATLYAARCASCHADAMTGGAHAPPLKGAAFGAHWRDATARSLYARIRSTMPMDDPGSLSPEETRALVAAIMAGNGQRPASALQSPADLDKLVLTFR